jgi:hypothetical protein
VKPCVRTSVCVSLFSSLLATTAFAQPGAPPATPPPAQAPAPPPPPVFLVAPAPTLSPPAVVLPRESIPRSSLSVRVDSTRPSAVLERRVSVKEQLGAFALVPYKSTEATWEPVCVTPCAVDLDRYSTYRVNAQNHISRSTSFTLPQNADALHLKIKAGNLVVHRTGEIMTGIGLAAIIVGGGLLIAASDFRHPDNERAAGAMTGGAGAVFAAIGIPLALASATKVHTESEEEIATVYFNHGRNVPFLPNIPLGHGFTLTQRGITF